jgi:hypothetical protein
VHDDGAGLAQGRQQLLRRQAGGLDMPHALVEQDAHMTTDEGVVGLARREVEIDPEWTSAGELPAFAQLGAERFGLRESPRGDEAHAAGVHARRHVAGVGQPHEAAAQDRMLDAESSVMQV